MRSRDQKHPWQGTGGPVPHSSAAQNDHHDGQPEQERSPQGDAMVQVIAGHRDLKEWCQQREPAYSPHQECHGEESTNDGLHGDGCNRRLQNDERCLLSRAQNDRPQQGIIVIDTSIARA